MPESSRYMTIKSQLLLIIFVVALPTVGILTYSAMDQRDDAIAATRLESQRLADDIAAEQKLLVTASHQLLCVIAQIPEIQSRNVVKTEAILREILKISPQYLNIFIADRSGEMWASAVPLKNIFSVSDRRYFVNALASGQFSSGEYIVGRIFSKPTISFGYPYRNDKNEIIGVIALNLNLQHFTTRLEQSNLPPGTSYALFDHKGTVLARGLNPSQFVGKQDNAVLYRQMTESPNDKGAYIGPGLDGAIRFTSYYKLRLDGEPDPYMYIRTGIPVKAAVSKANMALLYSLLLLTPFLVLALLIARKIATRSIIQPVSKLTEASTRFAAGDLRPWVSDQVKGGELGELAKTFDSMAVALSTDFAIRLQTEEEIRTLNIGLEQRVIERTSQLESEIQQHRHAQEEISWLNEDLLRQKQSLETANNELESFSYSVSHDLRAPVRHISGYISILSEDFGDRLEEDAKGYLERIRVASTRMEQMIESLLKLSRVNRNEIVTKQVDLSGIMHEISEPFLEKAEGRQVRIDIHPGITANGDPVLLRIALENLFVNAWKYTSPVAETIIEFGSYEQNGTVIYFIKDNGVGFDMGYADKLFGAFQRLHNINDFEGIGIGLATTQRIIHRHGGKIWAEGKTGEGAAFYFTVS